MHKHCLLKLWLPKQTTKIIKVIKQTYLVLQINIIPSNQYTTLGGKDNIRYIALCTEQYLDTEIGMDYCIRMT